MNDPAGQRGEATGPPAPGGRAAIDPALDANRRWLRTVLLARGVERDCVDEVLQDVAASAIRGAGALRDARSAAPWLYRLAVVAALQHRRRAGRRRKLVERLADSGLAPGEAVDADPLDWLASQEEEQLVRRALAATPRRDAEILLLKYTENWTYRELAERLGLAPAAVEGRLRRARQRLRSSLARLAPSLATPTVPMVGAES